MGRDRSGQGPGRVVMGVEVELEPDAVPLVRIMGCRGRLGIPLTAGAHEQ